MKAHDLEMVGVSEVDGLTFTAGGAVVDFFDNDSTMFANSATRVATQAAVKSYVDAAVPGTGNLIFQLNSKVEITDTGVDGTIVMDADGSEVFNAQVAAQRLGTAANSRVELRQVPDGSPGVDIYSSTNQLAEFGLSSAKIGPDLINDYLEVNNGQVLAITNNAYFDLDSGDSTNHYFRINLNGTEMFKLDGDAGGGTGDVTLKTMTSGEIKLNAGATDVLTVKSAGVDVAGNLSVSGDLFVDGTTFVVNNQEVTTADDIITVNYGEVGPGVTSGQAGIEVDRGSATNYQFLFVEADDNFQIGEIGSLQAVGTREDSPTDQYFPLWNDSAKRFDTATSTISRIATGIQATVAAFDIKTSGGEDGVTINNNGSVELFYDNALVAATTANGITGAVWG